MMKLIRFFIPGMPVTKKNSMQMAFNPKTKKWFPVPSKAYKRYEKAAAEALDTNGSKEFPIAEKVNVCCVYMLPQNKDGTEPKKKPDLANLIEATTDILVKYKILTDDNVGIVARHDGSHAAFVDDESQIGTYIVISEA